MTISCHLSVAIHLQPLYFSCSILKARTEQIRSFLRTFLLKAFLELHCLILANVTIFSPFTGALLNILDLGDVELPVTFGLQIILAESMLWPRQN